MISASTMLDLALQEDRPFAIEVIGSNLQKSNVHLFSIFSEKASELKDPSLVEPLFDRLESEWNAHVYLAAAKALISYEDPEIDRRILSTRESNENLRKDWGGEALVKLLLEHNIH